jgi:flagellar protein FlaI
MKSEDEENMKEKPKKVKEQPEKKVNEEIKPKEEAKVEEPKEDIQTPGIIIEGPKDKEKPAKEPKEEVAPTKEEPKKKKKPEEKPKEELPKEEDKSVEPEKPEKEEKPEKKEPEQGTLNLKRPKIEKKIKIKGKIQDSYTVSSYNVHANIEIVETEEDFTPIYKLKLPKLDVGTQILMNSIRETLVSKTKIESKDFLDDESIEDLKKKFFESSLTLMDEKLPDIPVEVKHLLAGRLVNEMLGLGDLEILLEDGNLEEVVINNSKEDVWVYHKKFGWLKTNIKIPSEEQIHNYASSIARRIGRQITTLDPLLDAHLVSGDRVNATLLPISAKGNTITIRKFRRKPWTITDLINVNTINPEVTALIWLATEFEMNTLVSGGTGSGKTTFLNCLMPFIPPNQRIISIEDTQELNLPKFLHWVPMTVREPNPEGEGAVEMIDLLVNSLRMRPDRIIVGEIRRERQAEVLFEAMHTGHSVYATLHADTAEQTFRRLVNPPINVPITLLEALDLVIVMFRDRRSGKRRVYEVAEFVPQSEQSIQQESSIKVLYSWKPQSDKIEKVAESYRLMDKLKMHTGMSDSEIKRDLKDKENILNWLIKNNVNTVDAVGKVVAEYYRDPKSVMNIVHKNGSPERLIPKELLVIE